MIKTIFIVLITLLITITSIISAVNTLNPITTHLKKNKTTQKNTRNNIFLNTNYSFSGLEVTSYGNQNRKNTPHYGVNAGYGFSISPSLRLGTNLGFGYLNYTNQYNFTKENIKYDINIKHNYSYQAFLYGEYDFYRKNKFSFFINTAIGVNVINLTKYTQKTEKKFDYFVKYENKVISLDDFLSINNTILDDRAGEKIYINRDKTINRVALHNFNTVELKESAKNDGWINISTAPNSIPLFINKNNPFEFILADNLSNSYNALRVSFIPLNSPSFIGNKLNLKDHPLYALIIKDPLSKDPQVLNKIVNAQSFQEIKNMGLEDIFALYYPSLDNMRNISKKYASIYDINIFTLNQNILDPGAELFNDLLYFYSQKPIEANSSNDIFKNNNINHSIIAQKAYKQLNYLIDDSLKSIPNFVISTIKNIERFGPNFKINITDSLNKYVDSYVDNFRIKLSARRFYENRDVGSIITTVVPLDGIARFGLYAMEFKNTLGRTYAKTDNYYILGAKYSEDKKLLELYSLEYRLYNDLKNTEPSEISIFKEDIINTTLISNFDNKPIIDGIGKDLSVKVEYYVDKKVYDVVALDSKGAEVKNPDINNQIALNTSTDSYNLINFIYSVGLGVNYELSKSWILYSGINYQSTVENTNKINIDTVKVKQNKISLLFGTAYRF
jgi:hypothetical protein